MPPVSNTSLVQQIPLAVIKPNPNNPRRVITPDMVDAMAASIKAVGLKNPVKVTALPDGTYELISGHIRFAGAQKAGLDTIPALVLDLTPEQALLEAILDNRGQQMTWLELAESMESLVQTKPKPTQQAISEMLGVYQKDVSRKIGILNLLTPASREAIYTKSLNVFDGSPIPQTVVERLTDLDDAQKVEQALTVAIDRKMTEPQAKKLVEWIKAGNSPETYSHPVKSPKVKTDSTRDARSPQGETNGNASNAPIHQKQGIGDKSYVIQGIKNAASLFRDQFISGMSKYMARALAGAAWVIGFTIMAMIVQRIWFTPTQFVSLPAIGSEPSPQPTPVPTVGESSGGVSTTLSVIASIKPDAGASTIVATAPIIVSPTPLAEAAKEKPAETPKPTKTVKAVKAQTTPKAQKAKDDVGDEVIKKVVPDVADELVKKLF